MRASIFSLLFFVLFLTAADARPPAEGFRTSAKQAPYEVRGNSVGKLINEMQEKGPLDDGKRFFGKTDWDIRWQYRYERRGGGFVITALTVTADITYRLPRRILPQGRPDSLAAQWTRFMDALNTHEQGHGQNAVQHAKALYATLRAHSAFASAEELEDFIKAEGDKCLADTRAADVEYDRRTEHGATQGATLR